MPVKRYNGSDWEVISGVGLQGPAGNDGTAPLTTKGQLLTRTASAVSALAVGSNDQVLTADSSTATGLKWATPAAGGMTLISTTTLSGATVTLSSIPQTYVSLYLVLRGLTNATANGVNRTKLNGANLTNTSGVYNGSASQRTNTYIENGDGTSTLRTDANNIYITQIDNYASTTTYKTGINYGGCVAASTSNHDFFYGFTFRSNSAVTSIELSNGGGDFTGGTALLYGVK